MNSKSRALLFATAAFCASSCLAVVPAFAQGKTTTEAGQSSSQSNSTPQQLLQGATKAADAMKADPHFQKLLKQAKGIFIVPTMVKGGLVVGGSGGQGVLLTKKNGQWSEPAFLTIGTVSLGAEAGGAAGQVAMLLMTPKAVSDFSQANNFSLGANSGLTVIGYSAKGQAPVGKGDIVVWSNQSGAFVGADVSATDITSNTQQDTNFYGKHTTTQDILQGAVKGKPATNKLIDALPA